MFAGPEENNMGLCAMKLMDFLNKVMVKPKKIDYMGVSINGNPPMDG